jgi:prepilin-type N-terminal cleavage/methylation domain-containing protein
LAGRHGRLRLKFRVGEQGFTFLELVVALVVILILTAFSVKPVIAFLDKIKLQNAANGIKHLILNARMRAVSNVYKHCGVVFRVNPSSTGDDTVFAFLESNPPDFVYTPGQDSLYGKPFIVGNKSRVAMTVPTGYPTTIVFRGDGSANQSARIVVSMKNFVDTVKVLASTGKVKLVLK